MLRFSPHHNAIEDWAARALLAVLSAALFIEASLALRWPMVHDTPLLHYAAWAISELGLAPYRDVFETSMPGSLLFHVAIGRAAGWGDRGFQVVNLMWVVATLSLTVFAVARIDRRAAWAAAVIYGLLWYGNGPWMLLQRDGVAVLPIAAATALATSTKGTRRWAAFLTGLGFGCAASIKPHLAIGFPIVVLFPWASWGGAARRAWDEAVKALVWGTAGLLVPCVLAVAWVIRAGGFEAFSSMMTEFLPIHLSLDGAHVAQTTGERAVTILSGLRGLGGHAVWLAPVFVAFLRAVEPGIGRPARLRIGLWVSLAVAYAIEPALAGQFWDYHWLPFQYFAAVSAGLLLVTPPPAEDATEAHRRAPLILLLALVFYGVTLAPNLRRELMGEAPLEPKDGRVAAVATYLAEHLEPGDTVQPLDWAGGAVHGMLRAHAAPASRYLYDYMFYVEADAPLVQRMRNELVATLLHRTPRFVVRFDGTRVSGPSASLEFGALELALEERFAVVHRGDGFLIYERRPDAVTR